MMRVRYVGGPVLPLNDTVPRIVAFVVQERTFEVGARKVPTVVRTPVATGFLIGIRVTWADAAHVYVVTAAHAVQSGRDSWIRVTGLGGVVRDVPVAQWYFHPTADVAAAPFDMKDVIHTWWSIADFLDANPVDVQLGDDVYFAGLLAQVPEMHTKNVPLVRSGTLGRMFQDGVPIKQSDGTTTYVTAHLIDCRSYSGFSGSPCFVQLSNRATYLLGVVAAHFDERVALSRDVGDDDDGVLQDGWEQLRSGVSIGVGIVTPCERVRELLEEDDDLKKDRSEVDAAYTAKDHPGATLDAASADTGDEFLKFRNLTRRLVRVPKSEIDEKREQQS